MSEAYWIDSGDCGIEELLSRAGARRDWIEEVHWLPPAAESTSPPFPVRFDWPVRPPQDHALLHLLSQALAAGERNLILIAQGEVNAALLGGPKAVGRYNLSPKARLTSRFTYAGGDFLGWLESLAARLEPIDLDPADVGWLAADCPTKQQHAFPRAGWLENPNPLLPRMGELIERLDESRSPGGWLFSLPPEGPWLATLVERL